MRILIIHNFYQIRGGEDTVFEQEVALLKKEHHVEILTFKNNSSIKGMFQFLTSLWNVRAAKIMEEKLQNFQPDIVHIHNWHFACGPIIIRTCYKRNFPVYLTLHNFRLVCPSGILMKDGKIFTDSLKQQFPWSAIRNKVYRDSSILSFWLAFIVWFHQKIGTWKMVNKFIVLTDFAKKIFCESIPFLEPSKFNVKPNFSPCPNYLKKDTNIEDAFLFVGRLSDEKGINILMETFCASNDNLIIAGDGPLMKYIIEKASKRENIKYLGSVDKTEVYELMRKSNALIFPSVCFEGMPMTIIESFSLGKPVFASNLGAMSSMIQDKVNGLHFEPGNSEDLRCKIEYWKGLTPEEQIKMGQEARKSYEKLYTPEENLKQLMQIYESI